MRVWIRGVCQKSEAGRVEVRRTVERVANGAEAGTGQAVAMRLNAGVGSRGAAERVSLKNRKEPQKMGKRSGVGSVRCHEFLEGHED